MSFCRDHVSFINPSLRPWYCSKSGVRNFNILLTNIGFVGVPTLLRIAQIGHQMEKSMGPRIGTTQLPGTPRPISTPTHISIFKYKESLLYFCFLEFLQFGHWVKTFGYLIVRFYLGFIRELSTRVVQRRKIHGNWTADVEITSPESDTSSGRTPASSQVTILRFQWKPVLREKVKPWAIEIRQSTSIKKGARRSTIPRKYEDTSSPFYQLLDHQLKL